MSSPQGTEVAKGYATITVNDQTAAGLASMQKGVQSQVRQIQSTSQIARNSIQGIFTGLGSNITNTALGPLLNVGEGLAKLSAQTDDYGNKWGTLANNVSHATVVIGAALLIAGAKEKQATDQLANAIQNVGQQYDDYESQIEAVISAQAKLGNGSIQVQNALTTLTNSTHDTQEAISDMAEVSDLAAAKHESLNTAAKQVAVTIGGGGRLFRQYNIDIQKNVDGTTNYVAMNQQLAAVLSGQASAAADNFNGKLRSLGATAENAFAGFGKQYGGWVTGTGVALSILSTVQMARFASALRSQMAAQEAEVQAALAAKTAIEQEAVSYGASADAIVESTLAIAAANKAAAESAAEAAGGGAARGAGAGATEEETQATEALTAAKAEATAQTDAYAAALARENAVQLEAKNQSDLLSGGAARLAESEANLQVQLERMDATYTAMGLSMEQIKVIQDAYTEGTVTLSEANVAAAKTQDALVASVARAAQAESDQAVAATELEAAIGRVTAAMAEFSLSTEQAAAVTDLMTAGLATEAEAMAAVTAAAEATAEAELAAAVAGEEMTLALGPIGLLAAGIAATVGALLLFGKSETQVVGPVSGLTEALENQNGAFDANTSALIAQKEQAAGLSDIINKLGLSQANFTSGLNGNQAAAESAVKSLQDIITAGTTVQKIFAGGGKGGGGGSVVDLVQLNASATAAQKALKTYQDLQKQIALQETQAKEFLEATGNANQIALGLTATAFASVVSAVEKTNAAYQTGVTNIQAEVIANDQLKSELGYTEAAWNSLALTMSGGLGPSGAQTNGGITGLSQDLRNADESLQAVTGDFQPLTDAYTNWQESVTNTAKVESDAAYSIQQAQQSLQNARNQAATSAVNDAEQIASAMASLKNDEIQDAQAIASQQQQVNQQYVTDAKNISDAEASITDAQVKQLDAQKALTKARQDAAQAISDAQKALRDIPEENDKAAIALEAAQLKASQDAVTAAQTALNNSIGLTQQQLIDAQNKINIQAAANAAEAVKVASDQSKYDLTDAKNNLTDTVSANAAASKSAAQTIAAGVNGAQSVIDAQTALQDAQKATLASVKNLADVKKKAAQDEATQIQQLTAARDKSRTDQINDQTAIAKAVKSAAADQAQSAQQVQTAVHNLSQTQIDAKLNTQNATTAEEANRLKLNELEIQTGTTDGKVKAISNDIKNADKSLNIAFATKNVNNSLNEMQLIKRNIQEVLLEAGGMSISDAVSAAAKDFPYYSNADTTGSAGSSTIADRNSTLGAGTGSAHNIARGLGAATGGGIHGPGGPTGDKIPAWLSDGEWVIKAAAVNKYGSKFMSDLNGMKYATGGPVLIDFTNAHIGDLLNKARTSAAAKPSSSTTPFAGPIAPVGGDHMAIIRQALGLSGVAATPGNISDVNIIVTHESGWNANAINLSDSNAAAGHPSQGLMQTIPSTFEGHRLPSLPDDITNPLANLVAGIRYAVGRYGSLDNVPGVEGVHNGSGYVGYDSGGYLPPGDTLVRNKTGKPEPVFTNEQAKALANNAGGVQIHGDVHLHLEAKDVKEFNDVVKLFEQLPQKFRAMSGATLNKRTGS